LTTVAAHVGTSVCSLVQASFEHVHTGGIPEGSGFEQQWLGPASSIDGEQDGTLVAVKSKYVPASSSDGLHSHSNG
jgi:hypothetical protein